jgi:large subunit ribosomal protein L18
MNTRKRFRNFIINSYFAAKTMLKVKSKYEKRKLRHNRVRAKLKGTVAIPRLSVFRSNKHIWTQLIDDALGKTLTAASDSEIKVKKGEKKTVLALKVGGLIAKRALEKKISMAVFDRSGYKYHGIVKAVAEGARKEGLKL